MCAQASAHQRVHGTGVVLTRDFNPHRGTTEQFDELTATTARRYGSGTQAVVFVLYEELIKLRRLLLADPCSPLLQARVAGLREQIQASYDTGGYLSPGPAPNARVVSRDPLLIEYDRDVFEKRYRPAVPTVARNLVELRDDRLGVLRTGACYMFVIDDRGRFMVWCHPFQFGDLVFGRNRATVDGVPVAHPMLVPERLRVAAAGEIVMLGEDRIGAAIVNTKSGHFRVPPSCEELIRVTLAARAGLSARDLDIFCMDPARTRDGIALVEQRR